MSLEGNPGTISPQRPNYTEQPPQAPSAAFRAGWEEAAIIEPQATATSMHLIAGLLSVDLIRAV